MLSRPGPLPSGSGWSFGFEGVVAKNHSSLYRPNDRGWVKVKDPNDWRRDAEIEAMQRSAKRRSRRVVRRTATGT